MNNIQPQLYRLKHRYVEAVHYDGTYERAQQIHHFLNDGRGDDADWDISYFISDGSCMVSPINQVGPPIRFPEDVYVVKDLAEDGSNTTIRTCDEATFFAEYEKFSQEML